MGEVFRARDPRLGLDVAIKVLPAAMSTTLTALPASSGGSHRRRAQPHIVTIYSVEEADGIHFLTMELVEGQAPGPHYPRSWPARRPDRRDR